MRSVHLVAPGGIDDRTRPSGGNTYDRRLCEELEAIGWAVTLHAVPGSWPSPDAAALQALEQVVGRIPDGAAVLLDGLVASAAPEVLAPSAGRLRMIPIVHMPLGHDCERAVLSAADAVVTTSAWTRSQLLLEHSLPEHCVHVAEPGADSASLAPGTDDGGSLLCVAAVIPGKGQDVLLDALAQLGEAAWECVFVGSLDRDHGFANSLRRRAAGNGLAGRVRFTGPQVGAGLDRSYAAADVLVLPSRAEAYGMVVTEALARGLPLIASDVGGVPEALGTGGAGLLVPPGDAAALGAALRSWLGDAELRQGLRAAAMERRASLPAWAATAAVVAGVIESAAR